MLKISQLTTEKDLREAEKIARRRLQERQRRDRILDTKSRIFGLDTAALADQIAEKKREKDAEQRREKEFDTIEKQKLQELTELDQEEQEMKRKMYEETELFRKTQQGRESTREFDLNDKDALKKEAPPRVSDNDPWLSVSGAQKFAGEDLAHSERLKAQKEEQRMWLQRQIEEKRRNIAASKSRDKDIYSALIASANREEQLLAMSTARKNELTRENAEYNQRLARERQNQKISDRVAEEKDNLAEIYNHLSSDILKENPETAKSALSRNRKLQYMYRGMSKAEVESYRQAQLQQQQELLRKMQAEKRQQRDQHAMESSILRKQELEQRNMDRLLKNEVLDLKDENQRLASIQLAEQEALNKDLTENRPTEEYYQQFNTTSR